MTNNPYIIIKHFITAMKTIIITLKITIAIGITMAIKVRYNSLNKDFT